LKKIRKTLSGPLLIASAQSDYFKRLSCFWKGCEVIGKVCGEHQYSCQKIMGVNFTQINQNYIKVFQKEMVGLFFLHLAQIINRRKLGALSESRITGLRDYTEGILARWTINLARCQCSRMIKVRSFNQNFAPKVK
jgi:hypothetical protein